jgi:hypothetical protein
LKVLNILAMNLDHSAWDGKERLIDIVRVWVLIAGWAIWVGRVVHALTLIATSPQRH